MASLGLLALIQLLSVAFAQYTIDSQSCVDPSGFQSCYANAQGGGGECQKECGEFSTSEDCILACGCVYFAQGINCALTHCWNQVYSCGYQALAIGTLQICGLGFYVPPSPIPYFPAPANAPGGCSCNIGAAFNSIAEYNYLSTQCSKFGYPSSQICDCCSLSGILSSYPDICPEQNTDALPGYVNPNQYPGVASIGLAGCDFLLPAATCKAYNIPTPTQAAIPSFYTYGAIPSAGTKSISNNPGALSSPISGTVITWTIDKVTNVVTAVSGTATSGSVSQAKSACPRMLALLAFSTLAITQFS